MGENYLATTINTSKCYLCALRLLALIFPSNVGQLRGAGARTVSNESGVRWRGREGREIQGREGRSVCVARGGRVYTSDGADGE